MDHFEEETGDVDQRLNELSKTFDELRSKCMCRSSLRVSDEISRLAKSNRRLIPYMHARFNQMNQAQGQLQPEMGREVAIELIVLLENQERATLLQPNFPEQEYFHTVSWMSSCAYDNLGKHTAKMQGYNSDGVHECINEGIQVCRRTGKLRCITCFREYATDVYLAADDLDMAMHYSRLVQALPEGSPNSERRWVGAKNEIWLRLLAGQLEQAEAVCQKALQLADSYHTPVEARMDTLVRRETVGLLLGKIEARDEAAFSPRTLPPQEFVSQDLDWDKRDALRACCLGEFDRARQLLERWDRQLTQQKCLDDWFEVRLRLLAVERLAGATERIDRLTKPLVEKARTAKDWLTLHRLGRLLDPNETPSPLALLAPLPVGPFSSTVRAAVPAEMPAEAPPATGEGPPNDAPPPTPLEPMIAGLFERLRQAGEDAAQLEAVREQVLAVEPAEVTHPFDAVRLVHLLLFTGVSPQHAARVWRWAEAAAKPCPDVPDLLSLLATLGSLLRHMPDSPVKDIIDDEALAGMFRKSLELDPFNPHGHARAGDFFLARENLGEAERCYARGFRLARDHGYLADRLAEVYDRTDRPSDAMAALDLCLRSGCADPNIAWKAVSKANQLEHFDSMLTYLDRFEELAPDQPWAGFYRAVGLLETGKASAALLAIAAEEKINPTNTFSVAVLRCTAFAQLGQLDASRQQLQRILDTRLSSLDYLTPHGVSMLLNRLWKTVAAWPAEDPLRQQLTRRLLACGIAPDSLFEPFRAKNEVVGGINHYRCILQQPLDGTWPNAEGCLATQTGWKSFLTMWGVLAADETEAEGIALAWQAKSFAIPARVAAIEQLGENFTDRPGVVWLGERWTE